MRFLAILVMLASSAAYADTGLIFPSNDDAPFGDVFAFKWDDPEESFGLPMWGTADGGITYMWEYYPYANQDDYYTTFFWSRGDGGFASGGYEQFYGAHPYPWSDDGSNAGQGKYGAPSDTHGWEIASGIARPTDWLRLANGDPGKYVTYNRWYHQALTATKIGSTIRYRFYFDLPNVTTEYYIEISGTKNLPDPTDPVLYFGDNPWWSEVLSHERMNGIFRNLRIIDDTLTQSEIVQEADSDVLVTASARNSVFYHNPNPTPTDITDKSGRGNHPSWVDDMHKPSLYSSTGQPGVAVKQRHPIKVSGIVYSQGVSEKTGDEIRESARFNEKDYAANCLGQEKLQKGQQVILQLNDACGGDISDNSIQIETTDPIAVLGTIGAMDFDMGSALVSQKKGVDSTVVVPATIKLGCPGIISSSIEASAVATIRLEKEGICVETVNLKKASGTGSIDDVEVILDKVKASAAKK